MLRIITIVILRIIVIIIIIITEEQGNSNVLTVDSTKRTNKYSESSAEVEAQLGDEGLHTIGSRPLLLDSSFRPFFFCYSSSVDGMYCPEMPSTMK